MKISELKQRLKNIKDKDFCYSIAETEINSLYAIILYYMALETNIDTGHTRKLWIQAINRISNVLSKLIPVPNYDIWKNYIFLNDLKESNFVSVNYGSYGITVKSDDEVAAHFHVARTVVRRAERRIVSLAAQEDLNPLIQKYVNRLSDLMFVLARYSEEVENKKWKSTNLNI